MVFVKAVLFDLTSTWGMSESEAFGDDMENCKTTVESSVHVALLMLVVPSDFYCVRDEGAESTDPITDPSSFETKSSR